jgi:hypothetical protein
MNCWSVPLSENGAPNGQNLRMHLINGYSALKIRYLYVSFGDYQLINTSADAALGGPGD